MKLLIVVVTLLGAISLRAKEVDLNEYSHQIGQFVEDVSLVMEPGEKEKLTKKLPNVVTYFVDSKDPALGAAAISELQNFCKAADVSCSPVTTAPYSSIAIYIGSEKEMLKIAKTYSGTPNLKKGSDYWHWWNDKKTITQAVIFLCTDIIKDPKKQLAALPPLFMPIFGLPLTSKEFKDSCLYPNNEFSTLRPIDIKLLHFYYRSVPAGTDLPELRKLVKEKWEKGGANSSPALTPFSGLGTTAPRL